MAEAHGFRSWKSEMEVHNFSHLEGATLRVLYLEEPPFVNNADLDSGFIEGHWNGPGIVMDILKIVGEKHRLTYTFNKSEDGVSYGQRLSDGTWDGMIGKLQRDEIDIIATSMIVNDERKEAMDFTASFMTTASGMLIRSPDQFIDNRFLIVTAPLEWQVWALIALSIVISGFIFKGVCIGLRHLNMEVQFSLLDCIWIFYAIFVQQDLSRLPSCAATRTMLSFWWLASLSICGFFTGNMVALFAVTRSVLPFNTRDDMVKKIKDSGYKIVLQNSSDVRMNFIRDSGLQVFEELWYEMKDRGKWINVTTIQEGIDQVIHQPKLVLVGAKETLEALASQTCAVTTLDGDLIPVWYAIGMRKGSPYVPMFDDVINKLAENGFVDKWLHDAQMMQAYYRGTRCNTSLGAGLGTGGNIDIAGDAIAIEKAQGVFWLLVAGIILGTSCLILEKLWRIIRPPHHAHIPSTNTAAMILAQQQQQQKSSQAVQVIAINPATAIDQHPIDVVESVDSYKPKVKTDAFIREMTPNFTRGDQSRNPGGNQQQQQQQAAAGGMYGNRFGNFEGNTYGNTYGNVMIERPPHAVGGEDDGLKHRHGTRIQIIR